MYTFYFEKLDVWQNGRKFVNDIYTVTDTFPVKEQFGITSQIRRASLSITANISEGFSRQSNKEKSRFINMAYSSSWEIINFLILSKDLKFINENQYIKLRSDIEYISNQLNSLYKKLTKDENTQN
ncbi:four helix bundle protein [Mesoflavibacter zeaxanthinifaciens]|uniref:four helix bundle protein n=1 Tax=Mesoflavibacter zeaxanthinifaciens TaxID=393060 RepID=UPI0026ED64D4|nr:four helix bundle protein [Mesoflavibacter zeaxanthinifaciens]